MQRKVFQKVRCLLRCVPRQYESYSQTFDQGAAPMKSGLPDKRSMWMRAFYGFGPEHDGYVGWTKPAGRDRILHEISDGDLILIYGSGSVDCH